MGGVDIHIWWRRCRKRSHVIHIYTLRIYKAGYNDYYMAFEFEFNLVLWTMGDVVIKDIEIDWFEIAKDRNIKM